MGLPEEIHNLAGSYPVLLNLISIANFEEHGERRTQQELTDSFCRKARGNLLRNEVMLQEMRGEELLEMVTDAAYAMSYVMETTQRTGRGLSTELFCGLVVRDSAPMCDAPELGVERGSGTPIILDFIERPSAEAASERTPSERESLAIIFDGAEPRRESSGQFRYDFHVLEGPGGSKLAVTSHTFDKILAASQAKVMSNKTHQSEEQLHKLSNALYQDLQLAIPGLIETMECQYAFHPSGTPVPASNRRTPLVISEWWRKVKERMVTNLNSLEVYNAITALKQPERIDQLGKSGRGHGQFMEVLMLYDHIRAAVYLAPNWNEGGLPLPLMFTRSLLTLMATKYGDGKCDETVIALKAELKEALDEFPVSHMSSDQRQAADQSSLQLKEVRDKLSPIILAFQVTKDMPVHYVERPSSPKSEKTRNRK